MYSSSRSLGAAASAAARAAMMAAREALEEAVEEVGAAVGAGRTPCSRCRRDTSRTRSRGRRRCTGHDQS